MSETASFVDPVFLARFGLDRRNVLDYFSLHLNPFRTKAVTSNDVLAMQAIGIGMLMAQGTMGEGPMSAVAAEEEYNKSLSRLTGEQYELLPPAPAKRDPAAPADTRLPTTEQLYTLPAPLYTIRHVLRTSVHSVKVLGIYYVVEGVIYKAPAARSLMKTNVARTAVEGLSSACTALADCARFHPATGYTWVFEADEFDDPVALFRLSRKRRKILDNRRPGERTAAEEEGIRASEAIDQILVRLSKTLSSKRHHNSEPANRASATTVNK
jgi:MED6 mediator sub complex component